MTYTLPPQLAPLTARTAPQIAALGHLPHRWGVNGVAFSPDGALLATVHETLRLWRVEDGQLEIAGQGGDGVMQAVAFLPDGSLLAVASADGTVRLWSAQHGVQMGVLRSQRSALCSVAISPDGALVAAGSSDFAGEAAAENVVQLWDARANWETLALTGPAAGVQVAFSPVEPLLAAGDALGAIWVWALDPVEPVGQQHMPGGGVSALAFSPDGDLLVAAGTGGGPGGGQIVAWDAASGAELGGLPAGGRTVNALAFSPDGSLLAAGGADAVNGPSAIRLWDAGAGRALGSRAGHARPINSLAFSPDGLLLASGGGDGARIWGVPLAES